MDKAETAGVFEHPYARSVATGSGPLDRISVRDYVREVEIGAFSTERGVTQRIQFNAVVEVASHTAAQDDDVDKVLSYDNITEAIETLITAGRINLLETFAERIAEAVLEDPRAIRIFLRVEKLDRIPGALGVEIVRSQRDEQPNIRPVSPSETASKKADPLVIALSETVVQSKKIMEWIEVAASLETPVVFCVPPLERFDPSETTERVALLSFDQAAWQLASVDPRLSVISTRTELEHAIRTPRLILWAPTKMVAEANDAPQLDRLANWLQSKLGASRLVAVGTSDIGETLQAFHPSDLKGI